MNGGAERLVALAAGGTGGHVFPARSLAACLTERDVRVVLVTDRRGGSVSGLAQGETFVVQAAGLAGKSIAGRLRSLPELAIGTLQARSLLRRLGPDAVVGFGGYASIPTMMAATFGAYATAVHEQNAVLGRANRLLAGRVDRIATSFPVCRGLPAGAVPKVVHTGMPVRAEIAKVRDRAYEPPAEDGAIRLLVFGGSQGARVFSDVVPEALGLMPAAFRRRLSVVQQCRSEDLERVRAAYGDIGIGAELATFFDDMPRHLAEAHLIVARAGASTVAEILVAGRPALLVPYPHAIDDHQSANAHAVAEAGAGWLMAQSTFTPDALAERLQSLTGSPRLLDHAAACARNAGRADAAERLADMVCDMLPSNGNSGERKAAA